MAGRAASTAADRAASITTNTNIHRVNTAADLARLRDEGTHLNPQELKELKARLRSLEEMAKFEDRFRLLERRERPHSNEDPDISEDVENVRNLRAPTDDDNSGTGNVTNYSLTRPPTELHASDPSSSESDDQRRHKRRRYNKGIKVTPSYTLRTGSSLREWGDWKRDIERVFEGDPNTYQHGSQKVLKALDYLDSNLKSLWYTYTEQAGGIKKWQHFLKWTRDNVQHGQNATATLYEQLNQAMQLSHKSPVQFNAYLASIERDLPQQTEQASAMTFYSKLSSELKRQFKTSNIQIPETRAKCVAISQRIWEGLHQDGPLSNRTRDFTYQNHQGDMNDRQDPKRGQQRPFHHRSLNGYRGSSREGTQIGHTPRPNTKTKDKDKIPPGVNKAGDLTCHKCGKSGHFRINCPRKDEQPARMQHRRKAPMSNSNSSDDEPSETD
jgi:hypothetical protein